MWVIKSQDHCSLKTSSSSFPYNWDNVIYVPKKIDSIINFKDSKCDLYTMEYISQLTIHCWKGLINCVLNCTNFPEGGGVDICSRQTVHHVDSDTENLVLVLIKKGKKKFTSPISDYKFLSSSKPLKIGPKDCVFSNHTY